MLAIRSFKRHLGVGDIEVQVLFYMFMFGIRRMDYVKNRIALAATLCLVLTTTAFAADSPIGWAAVNELGQNGTIGGGNGSFVIVTNKEDLAYYAGLTGPYTIFVDGYFNGPAGDINVESDKSIIGLGSGATLEGFGLKTNGRKNIIIRNLTIKNCNVDAIAIRDSHHVWIDHCDLSNCTDGLIDITIGSDYVTVSWCKLHNQDKVSLVNSGTQHFEDVGKCRVTYHHNWFYDNVQRNPRVGYGKSHMFNNYYSNISSYCVGYHTGAKVLVQNNYFDNCRSPFLQDYSNNSWDGNYGDAEGVGNIFVSCTGNKTGTGISFDPTFYYDCSFGLDTAVDVPSSVSSFSGPGENYEFVICPNPSNGAIDVATESPDLTWTDLVNETSWDIYFGTSANPPYQTSQTNRTFSTGTLTPNTDYYWKVNANTPSGIVSGELWHFRIAPLQASKPFPEDNATNAPLRIINDFYTCKPLELTWTAGLGATAHRVYFGTNPTLTTADYKITTNSPVFAPGELKHGTKYYWRVDSVKADDSIVPGNTWSFTTNAIVNSPEGRTEAENMVCNGRYFLEYQNGSWFRASGNWVVKIEAGPGVLSSIYSGPQARCQIDTTYFDEGDGTGHFSLFVDETCIDQWFASANNDRLTIHTSKASLTTGDEIRIEAYTNGGELTRTDCIDIQILPPDDDFTPPNPNPMTFAIPPQAAGIDTITMTATTASDPAGVEYLFTCTSGGGHSSAWQDKPVYTDTLLQPGTTYTYTVKARDKSNNLNETAPSVPASATTDDVTAGLIKINFQPKTSTVPSGYIPDDGSIYGLHSNGLYYGWNKDITSLTRERGINPDPRLDTIAQLDEDCIWEISIDSSTYNVEVAIGDAGFDRDGYVVNVEGVNYWKFISLAANEFAIDTKIVTVTDGKLTIDNGASGTKNTRICYVIITAVLPYSCSEPIAADLNGDCQVNFLDYTVFADAWATQSPLADFNSDNKVSFLDFIQLAQDWLKCNREPAIECWQDY
jgi:pectate lyase